MSLEIQVQQNTLAIKQLLDQSKNMKGLPKHVEGLADDDLIMLYLDAMDQTVSMDFDKFLSLLGSTRVGTDKNYAHIQSVASNEWSVEHNLSKIPSVTVLDENGEEIFGEIVYTDINNLSIKFNSELTGSAHLN
jgi:hypothetical protein